ITFDNSDKAESPLGYEQYDEITITRQVVVGGRNKYAINGVNVQNNRVQDLFRSVKLNVNNPHFLIMQGRITKVLNMKPPEILSMIEEAAGTRLYESKKQVAQKTIEKNAKLKEINDILDEEINPTMNKLKEERSTYLEYQKVEREYEHLSKFCIAFKFVTTQESCKKAVSDEQDVQALHRSGCGGQIEQGQHDIGRYEEDIGAVSEPGVSRVTGRQDRAAAGVQRQQEMSRLRDVFDALHAKSAIADSETERKQADMKLKHTKQELAKRRSEMKKTESEYRRDSSQLQTMEGRRGPPRGQPGGSAAHPAAHQSTGDMSRLATVATRLVLKSMGQLRYDETRVDVLETERRELKQELSRLKEKLDVLESRYPQLVLDYRDPEKGFDRSTVRGVVGKLFNMKDVATATALEVTAGGRLYNVVVDTEVVGKKLLERGQLQKRVTFIPLNKISSSSIDMQTIRHAEKVVGKENVRTALSCIQHEPRLQKAMEWVFGNTLICSDLDVAKRVAFDPRVQRRAVTLDGDVVDPAGTLTGGSRQARSSVLAELHALSGCQQRLRQLEQRLAEVEAELSSLTENGDRYAQLKQQLELQEVQRLEQLIVELEETQSRCAATEEGQRARVAHLEEQIRDQQAVRERELNSAEAEVKACKTRAEETRKAWQDRQQEEEQMRLEIADLGTSVQSTEEQIAAAEMALSQYAERLTEAQTQQQAAQAALAQAQAAVKAQKDVMNAQNKEIQQLATKKEKVISDNRDRELEIKQLDHKLSKARSDAKDMQERVKRMLSDHEWIATDQQFFGQPNTAYDFKATDPVEASKRIVKLEEARSKLGKNVNMRAMKMLGKAEEQFTDLMRKKRIVENDKTKIETVIRELDEKKNEALKQAWEQVNRDFGSIFGTLLPGTSARLQPPDGASVLDGLEQNDFSR
ncbi:structural maintenance of chromosomes protein 2-like, partial [Pollicipes pollicipes]|uniref:structural maintenance of chromosomes protein 2-like n=1 Tax=Pollicipes pollicipes TaxID=41117 RepID=UPI00188518D3